MAVRDSDPQPVQPEAAPAADTVATGEAAADGPLDGGDDPAGSVLIPLRRPSLRANGRGNGRAAQLPVSLRSLRRHAQLEPIGTMMRRVARHPAVVGSASAATILVARAGVEVLRGAITKDRRAQPTGRVFVSRRVVVEYVETWSRSR